MTFENTLERAPVRALRPYARNARTHSQRQLALIAKSIKRFGFNNPVLVDDALNIIAGHGRVEAAKLLGLDHVPILRLSHLSDTEIRAYILADNRLAERAGWNKELLAVELQGLVELDFEIDLIGFEPAEIDLILDEAEAADADSQERPEDEVPPLPDCATTVAGDVWRLGRHRLICGDARDAAALAQLMPGEAADLIFTDPPYNVPISGNVRKPGAHREFAMASGEMSKQAFEAFLKASLTPAAQACRDGAIAFVCMDWRHMEELLAAGREVFSELKNLCVWTKTNGGMGSLYRSQHELVFVYKTGEGAHSNNVVLGKFGRNRTNVWSYAGVNAFGRARNDELAMHPTCKPVALVEDAIKDVSTRNGIVLDPFGGSGATLIAAQKCGRRARLIEIDPRYCDVIVRRFEIYTGKSAHLVETSQSYEEISATRALPMEARHG